MSRTKGIVQRESTLTALKLLGAPNLHQCLWLPESATHKKLRVSFSTTSNFADQALPAIFFCTPMFGSRYGSFSFDKIAQEAGVRVICADRPGIGGTSSVPLEQRMNVWLETVRAVLDKLNVKHISLVSHSAGTMYSLNTLYQLRDVMDPVAPYAAYFAPWVHSDHSRAKLMTLVSKLPENVITTFTGISKFINTKIMPVGSWSGGVISSMAGVFQAESDSSSSGETTAQEKFGVDEETATEIDRLQMKYLFAEGVTGVDEETLFCLHKSDVPIWGVCEDFSTYVQDLTRAEKERRKVDESAPKLRVRVYYAESDIMIAKGGAEYFDRIWHQDGVAEAIDVQSKVLPKTNHDSVIIDLRKGGLREVFEEIHRIRTPATSSESQSHTKVTR